MPRLDAVSKKSARIAGMIVDLQGRELDAHYLGYFECFNQGLFYEAHDVLEELWLKGRKGPDGNYFKGLIQLAGAFVHLQKRRLKPAVALFKLTEANLAQYPEVHLQLDVKAVLKLARVWREAVERNGYEINPLANNPPPRLQLETGV